MIVIRGMLVFAANVMITYECIYKPDYINPLKADCVPVYLENSIDKTNELP